MAYVSDMKNGKYRVFLYDHGKRATKVIEAKSLDAAKKEALKMECRFEDSGAIDGKSHLDYQKVLLDDACTMYINDLCTQEKPIAEKTRSKYVKLQSYYLAPYFKGRLASSITTSDVIGFLAWLRTPDARINKSKKSVLADSTVYSIYTLLYGVLKYCWINRFITENPCDYLTRGQKPEIPLKEVDWYNDEEMYELIRVINEETEREVARIELMEATQRYAPYTLLKEKSLVLAHRLSVLIALNTAARRGEVLGLRRSDISETGQVHFHWNVVYTEDEGVYEEPFLKSCKDKYVWICDDLQAMIKQYIDVIDQTIEASNGLLQPTDRLFISFVQTSRSSIGRIPSPDNYSDWFLRFLKRNNLKRISFHKLRHTSISYMLHQGISPYVVMKIAGHKSLEYIEKTYGHVYSTDKAEASNKFQDIGMKTLKSVDKPKDENAEKKNASSLFEGKM